MLCLSYYIWGRIIRSHKNKNLLFEPLCSYPHRTLNRWAMDGFLRNERSERDRFVSYGLPKTQDRDHKQYENTGFCSDPKWLNNIFYIVFWLSRPIRKTISNVCQRKQIVGQYDIVEKKGKLERLKTKMQCLRRIETAKNEKINNLFLNHYKNLSYPIFIAPNWVKCSYDNM